jgi:hypothetical protein
MRGVIKLGLVVVVVVGFVIVPLRRSGEARETIFEGIVDWGGLHTSFYPGGNCFATPYWYVGAKVLSADLNVRREKTGKPHAMWVKFRGDVSVVGTDTRDGGQYFREIQSTEIIDTRAAEGCSR